MNKQQVQKLVSMAREVEEVMKDNKIEEARTRIELEAHRVKVSSKLNLLIGFIMAFDGQEEMQ